MIGFSASKVRESGEGTVASCSNYQWTWKVTVCHKTGYEPEGVMLGGLGMLENDCEKMNLVCT